MEIFSEQPFSLQRKESGVKYSTFVVRKIRFNRLTEVNYRANWGSDPIMRIRPVSVKLKDTE